REQLDARVRVQLVALPHRLGVQPCARVVEVVARDARDGRVAQAHAAHRLGDAPRLVGVVGGGLARVDLAEVAAPRALRAADEERRLAVLPALEDVGTARLLAHGVQLLALHEAVQLAILGALLDARLDPLGLLLDRRLRVAHLEAQQLPAVRIRRAHAGTPSKTSRNTLTASSATAAGETS